MTQYLVFVIDGRELKMNVQILIILISMVLFRTTYSSIILRLPTSSLWTPAYTARYVIHNTDWLSLATISSQEAIKGHPFVTLKSFSDGPKRNSTGNPYLYLTPRDLSERDIEEENKVTIMSTLAETNLCSSKKFDPQDPRCAKVMIAGSVVKVDKTSEEYTFGQNALFKKHPAMRDWPSDHNFFVAKVKIQQIQVLDHFGGASLVKIEDYFHVNLTQVINVDFGLTNLSAVVIYV